jgi:hypothetical protein
LLAQLSRMTYFLEWKNELESEMRAPENSEELYRIPAGLGDREHGERYVLICCSVNSGFTGLNLSI